MKIAVAGTGYVGMSIATLLAQHNHVTAVDVIPEKVELINKKKSPIQDDYIEKYLAEKDLDLIATLDGEAAYKDADFVVIAAPTNYDPQKNFFDTCHVEEVIDLVLKVNPDAVMVIKSTIPVGYTRNLYVQYAAKGVKKFNLLFSPEFLRESKALYDNLYPSRIIVGSPKIIDRPEFKEENEAILKVTDVAKMEQKAKEFAKLLQEGAIKENIDTLFMGMKEAEAVKLFANTYLALRVSYFNELDTYAEVKGLDTQSIIEGVGLDPRIGSFYNNPSLSMAKLTSDPNLANKIVVFDDPLTSLDQNRRKATIHELVRLMKNCQQLIVLSHNIQFLIEMTGRNDTAKNYTKVVRIAKNGNCAGIELFELRREWMDKYKRALLKMEEFVAHPTPGVPQEEAIGGIRTTLELLLKLKYCKYHNDQNGTFGELIDLLEGKRDCAFINPNKAEVIANLRKLNEAAWKPHHAEVGERDAFEDEDMTTEEAVNYTRLALRLLYKEL